jgi:hypothetical protein
MLCIGLPKGQLEGECPVNGEPCSFVIANGFFSFRPRGSDQEWDRRKILVAEDGDTTTGYVCTGRTGESSIYDDPLAYAPPTHEELQHFVLRYELEFQTVWTRRNNDMDILVTGDLRRAELMKICLKKWGHIAVAQVLAEAERDGSRPIMTALQPPEFVDLLDEDPIWERRQIAKELRQIASIGDHGRVVVPLLVLFPGALWTTHWAPPGSGTAVIRYKPPVRPESN